MTEGVFLKEVFHKPNKLQIKINIFHYKGWNTFFTINGCPLFCKRYPENECNLNKIKV